CASGAFDGVQLTELEAEREDAVLALRGRLARQPPGDAERQVIFVWTKAGRMAPPITCAPCQQLRAKLLLHSGATGLVRHLQREIRGCQAAKAGLSGARQILGGASPAL